MFKWMMIDLNGVVCLDACIFGGFLFCNFLFRWIYVWDFGLDGLFFDFSNGPFGGDVFNDFVIGTTWIFRFVWFLWTFRIIQVIGFFLQTPSRKPKKTEFIPQ